MKKTVSILFALVMFIMSVLSVSAADNNKFVYKGDIIQYSVYIEPLDVKPVGMQMDVKFNNDVLDITNYDYSNIPSAVANFNSNDDGTIRVNNSTLEGMDFSSKTTLISVDFIVTQKTSIEDVSFEISVPCLYDIDLVDIENFVVDDEIKIISTNVSEEETSVVTDGSIPIITENSIPVSENVDATSDSDIESSVPTTNLITESATSTSDESTSDENGVVNTGDSKGFFWGVAIIFCIVILVFVLAKCLVIAKFEK